MTECYFPGCKEHAGTKEHIPPRCFFTEKKNKNLMTVKSCPKHNNEKTMDDIYVLAQICLNLLHTNNIDVQSIFKDKVIPQLMHNEAKLKRMLLRGAEKIKSEGMEKVAIKVDIDRFNSFFTHLTHGVLFKQFGVKINPKEYFLHHHYPDFITNVSVNQRPGGDFHKEFINSLISEDDKLNQTISFEKNRKISVSDIYSIKFLGADSLLDRRGDNGKIDFTSSISVIHKIFGSFYVVSLLTRVANFENSPIHSNMHEFIQK